jgi:Uma2 family endonuclease
MAQDAGLEVIIMGRSATATDPSAQQPLDPEIVALLPEQGAWSEQDYLWLTNHTNRLVEFADGYIEVLPMPADEHQAILGYLYRVFYALIETMHGRLRFAPLRLRLPTGKYREPDLLLLRSPDDPRWRNEGWEGADLVVEIVSPDDPDRDFVTKRREYAQTGIPEYWIVDPQGETITVLRLEDTVYVEHGVFGRGAAATSFLFPDFQVSVDAVLDAE